jgi:hypothetical protein
MPLTILKDAIQMKGGKFLGYTELTIEIHVMNNSQARMQWRGKALKDMIHATSWRWQLTLPHLISLHWFLFLIVIRCWKEDRWEMWLAPRIFLAHLAQIKPLDRLVLPAPRSPPEKNGIRWSRQDGKERASMYDMRIEYRHCSRLTRERLRLLQNQGLEDSLPNLTVADHHDSKD